MAQLRMMAGDSGSRKSENGLHKTDTTRIVPAPGVASECHWNRAGIEHRRGAAHNHPMLRALFQLPAAASAPSVTIKLVTAQGANSFETRLKYHL